MNILFVVSEVEDIVKTGGLADVGKSLPLALQAAGEDVRIVIPYYKGIEKQHDVEKVGDKLTLTSGPHEYQFSLYKLRLNNVIVYCIDYPDYFARDGIYSDSYHAYEDNGERFAFFSDAVLSAAEAVNFKPDIVHCHDWHTALTPYFLKKRDSAFFAETRSVFTIHNGAYQGISCFSDMPYLHSHHELSQQLDGDSLNMLRIAIRYADKITAVSPNYAYELTTPLGSHRLYDELDRRREDVSGILNGCDYSQWDPSKDKFLPHSYDRKNMAGKKACKAALQKETGLATDDSKPLIGMVCRLTEQKGFDYILPILDELMQHQVQLLIVGTGDPNICEILEEKAKRFPTKFVFLNLFSNSMAHLLEAGSDFFLMPSLFEPCGLNQMYSLTYGTIPIVRTVGGLKDTVVDINDNNGPATGFRFEHANSDNLLHCVRRALLFYYEAPDSFAKMRDHAMQTQFTWDYAAKNYISLYAQTVR